ncbi:M48 family metalloprotease [Pseudomonas sp. Fl5BN2]|uniref:M48 family metallopeptidase n=1 Tax=Pseudomonas sp. Fl5BN2 TaxID=2697652 RepID=UPI0013788884|nr:M48 family metallopeptidase [Pseudomonas sp. Fl5BN2]NBF04919.1 M48 family metalloprotease [Pseudomonas sp. Fl5BN2]
MNFFQHQERAKRRTSTLVLLMTLAITGLVSLAGLGAGLLMKDSHGTAGASAALDWELMLIVAGITLLVIVLGSLWESLKLSAGGQVVAQELGGLAIDTTQMDAQEHRLLNIVEEIALASGCAAPAIYVLPEEGINAFAAGLTPQDAAIGVTRGALQALNRDELQGVIAHEFSHIHNGDMRLNTRLVSAVFGIMMLSILGVGFLYALTKIKGNSRFSFGLAMILMFLGVVLVVLGSIGTLFGWLIQSAVSRQREFLADASAVQFTRNPKGIANALKKIAESAVGSHISADNAAQYRHMFFGNSGGFSLFGLFATHPPLPERIRRLESEWDGQFSSVAPQLTPSSPQPAGFGGRYEPASETALTAAKPGGMPTRALELFTPSSEAPVSVEARFDLGTIRHSIDSIGAPQEGHLQQARSILRRLPKLLLGSARNSDQAQALIYGLLLSSDAQVLARQLELLRNNLETRTFKHLQALQSLLRALSPDLRLPLIDLSLAALKQLPITSARDFIDNLNQLVNADQQVELMEWTLLRIIERNIRSQPATYAKYTLAQRSNEVAVLLSALANAGHSTPQQSASARNHAWSGLPFAQPAAVEGTLEQLDSAIALLRQLLPQERHTLLSTMARCITYDGHVTVAEAELMRAVADLLDCPMPPLLGGDSVPQHKDATIRNSAAVER